MRMQTRLAVAFLAVAITRVSYGAPLNQLELLDRTIALTAKVVRLAKQKSARFGDKQLPSEARTELVGEVESLLRGERSAAVLARTALSTLVLLKAGQAGDEPFDDAVGEVLLESWFAAITRIEKSGGLDALVALKDMKRTAEAQSLDGAVSLALRKAQAEVERKMVSTQSK